MITDAHLIPCRIRDGGNDHRSLVNWLDLRARCNHRRITMFSFAPVIKGCVCRYFFEAVFHQREWIRRITPVFDSVSVVQYTMVRVGGISYELISGTI